MGEFHKNVTNNGAKTIPSGSVDVINNGFMCIRLKNKSMIVSTETFNNNETKEGTSRAK